MELSIIENPLKSPCKCCKEINRNQCINDCIEFASYQQYLIDTDRIKLKKENYTSIQPILNNINRIKKSLVNL